MKVNLIFELKKLNLLEMLSVAFFISVGISLLYRYGFYSELGIDWFLNTLTPQHLLISSLPLIAPIFFSIGLGFFVSRKFKKILNSLLVQLVLFTVYMTGLISITFNIGLPFSLWVFAFIFISTIYAIDAFESIHVLEDGSKEIVSGHFHRNVIVWVLFLYSIFSVAYSPVIYGASEASLILSGERHLNSIDLRSGDKNWLLLEVNGDKLLLINRDNPKLFKMLEYKDVDKVIVN